VAVSAGLPQARAYAQGCCSAGGAAAQIGLFRQSQLAPGQAAFALYFGRVTARQSFEGTQKVDDPQMREADLSALSGSLALGLPWELTAYVAAPLVWRDRSQLTVYGGQSATVGYDGTGWADPVIALSWRFLSPTTSAGWTASVGSGLQLPLGEDEERKDGVRLPNDMQPATGDWNWLLFQSLEWSPNRWTVFEHSTWTATWANTVGYRLGPSVRADVGASFSWTPVLEPFVRLDLWAASGDQSRERDLPSTGSTRLYVRPGLVLALRPQRLLLAAELGVPLYQNYYGRQLGPRLVGRFFLPALNSPPLDRRLPETYRRSGPRPGRGPPGNARRPLPTRPSRRHPGRGRTFSPALR
jgi:hypothetical protein